MALRQHNSITQGMLLAAVNAHQIGWSFPSAQNTIQAIPACMAWAEKGSTLGIT
jgi:hypothetical protein